MAALADGSGWLIFDAAVAEDDLPPTSPFGGGFFGTTGFGSLFSGRGPDIPELSWVPGAPGGRRTEPLSVGIRHGSGPKAKVRLADAGRAVPDGWWVVQDNPRRGLVAQVPSTEGHAVVLAWLLGAAAVLATVPLTGEWRAVVHLR